MSEGIAIGILLCIFVIWGLGFIMGSISARAHMKRWDTPPEGEE